jgi:membrane-bound lytic murein transglycosylase B
MSTAGKPTRYTVTMHLGQTDKGTLMATDILPTFSVVSFVAKEAALEGTALAHTGPLALIKLRNGPTYLAGTENFYTMTHYNWGS